MKINVLWRWSVLWALVGLTACTTVTPPALVRPTGPSPVEQARLWAEQGQYAEAAQRYQQLAQTATIAERAEYLLRAAENALKANQIGAAEANYAAADPQALPAALRPLHTLVGADLRLRAGDPAQALRLSEQVAPAELAASVRALRHDVRARALEQQGQGREAAMERIARDPYLNAAERVENQARLIEVLARLPLQQLQALQSPPPDSLGGWANLALRLRRPEATPGAGDALVAAWRREYPNLPLSQAAADRVRASLRQTPPEPAVVALLLPGQGKFTAEAEAIRDGFISAVLTQHLPWVVKVYTYANAEAAEAEYQRAVQESATWVVGPLDKEAVTRLARLPRLAVPVLALNQVQAVAPAGNFYQFGLLPEDELQALIQLARRGGVTRAYVLAPESPWGERLGSALERAWNGGGMTVYRYPAQAPVLGDAALPGRTPGDAALLVADAAQARSLLPILRSANVPVYASAQVFEGVADERLEGVSFCEQPWLLASSAVEGGLDAQAVRRDWPGLGIDRLRLFAFGADAARLAALNLETLGNAPATGVYGNSGRLYRDAQRRIHREPECARFFQGWPQRIDSGGVQRTAQGGP